MKYTKNNLCIKFGFSFYDYVEMQHGQQNIKSPLSLPAATPHCMWPVGLLGYGHTVRTDGKGELKFVG